MVILTILKIKQFAKKTLNQDNAWKVVMVLAGCCDNEDLSRQNSQSKGIKNKDERVACFSNHDASHHVNVADCDHHHVSGCVAVLAHLYVTSSHFHKSMET